MSKSLAVWIVTAVLAAGAGAASPSASLTVDELIAKNLAARGGKERLLALRSARITGTLTIGSAGTAPMTLEWRRPSHVRLSFRFQGLDGVQAYDGTRAWTLLPFHGQTEPELVAEEELQRFRDMADFDGPLVDYQTKGHQVELVGREPVQGTDAYKLKLTRAHGDPSFLYLDAATYLVILEVGKDFDTTISDYKPFGGVLFACSKERRAKGAAAPAQVTTFDKIELDVELPDSRFAMPTD